MIPYTDISEVKGHIRYPLPPTVFHKWADEMDVYVRFMRALRQAPATKAETKIFTALQAAAVGSGQTDADVALILVDLGLRAPRGAFVPEFLYMVDQAVCRMAMGDQRLSPAMLDLLGHWRNFGGVMCDGVGGGRLPTHVMAKVMVKPTETTVNVT